MIENIDVDGINIPFDSEWKKLSIALSGGADSAMLAYLLCEIITEKDLDCEIHVISHTRCWKAKPWQRINAIDVLNNLLKTFPNVTFQRHLNFIPPEFEYANIGPNLTDEYGKQVSGDNIELRSYAEYVCHTYSIPVYFNAVTRNPRLENFNGMAERDIEPTEDNKHLTIMEHMGGLACHPFRFVEKNWVMKQYKDRGLDEFLNLTRSCEGTFADLDYTNYKPGQEVPVCGECFWCKEREWAIEQNK